MFLRGADQDQCVVFVGALKLSAYARTRQLLLKGHWWGGVCESSWKLGSGVGRERAILI